MMPSPVSSAHTLTDEFAGLPCLIGNTPLIAGVRAVGRACGVCADSQRPVWRNT